MIFLAPTGSENWCSHLVLGVIVVAIALFQPEWLAAKRIERKNRNRAHPSVNDDGRERLPTLAEECVSYIGIGGQRFLESGFHLT